MKMLNKYSPSIHFYSLIMHIWISGVSADMGILPLQWLHHQSQLGGDIGILRLRVRWFGRMLHLNISSSSIISVAHSRCCEDEFTIWYLFHKSQHISEQNQLKRHLNHTSVSNILIHWKMSDPRQAMYVRSKIQMHFWIKCCRK